MSKEVIERVRGLLKAKFEGVSDSILNRISERISRNTQAVEEAETLVEGVTFQQVLESYGDSRATEAQETAIKNYERKYGLKEGAKIEAEVRVEEESSQGGKGGSMNQEGEEPAWLKKLLETNRVLTKRIEGLEADKILSTRKQKLMEVVERLPNGLRKAYERTPIEGISEEDFNSMIGEIGSEVEGIMKDHKANGAIFGRPSSGGGHQGGEELSKEQMEAIGKREGATKDGQPF